MNLLLEHSVCGRIFLVLLATWLILPLPVEAAGDPDRFKNLRDYALLSDVAYRDKGKIEQALALQGYTLTTYGQLPGYGVSYYLATSDVDRRQVIAVRGTSNVENAMVDVALQLLPNSHTGIKLHQGFALSADYIYQKVKAHLISDFAINTTGHSLGGATALILAMYLDADGYDVNEVVTFGQPKVTNISGSRKFAHLDVTRVVTPKDMVPLVPPLDPMDLMNMDIYWHLGTEIVLQAGSEYSELEGVDSMMRATDFMNEMVSTKNLQHHYMTVYINSITPKLVNAKQVPYKSDFSIVDLLSRKPVNSK
ncbi:MAG: lipase family protein [Gammaproteobacteria bacterium]|nr:lipase family protein [Gammaproteobacteria bacterium]